MGGNPYCHRCQTQVRLEQDGQSCSNCGAKLVQPIAQAPAPTAAPAPGAARRPHPKRPAGAPA